MLPSAGVWAMPSTVAVTVVVPTCVLAAQLSAWKSACEHSGVASGLPISPGGKCSVVLFALSVPFEYLKTSSTVTSGCAPAALVDGVTVTVALVRSANAEVGAHKSAPATTSEPKTLRIKITPPGSAG